MQLILLIEVFAIFGPLALVYLLFLAIALYRIATKWGEVWADPAVWMFLLGFTLAGWGLYAWWILWESVYLRERKLPNPKGTFAGITAGVLVAGVVMFVEPIVLVILYVPPSLMIIHLLFIVWYRRML